MLSADRDRHDQKQEDRREFRAHRWGELPRCCKRIVIVKGFTKSIPKKPSALPGTANRTILACCQETKVQQFTSETPEQTMPESWLWVKNLELASL